MCVLETRYLAPIAGMGFVASYVLYHDSADVLSVEIRGLFASFQLQDKRCVFSLHDATHGVVHVACKVPFQNIPAMQVELYLSWLFN